MPTYEYACDPCRTVFKVMHRMSETGPTACPECAGTLRRVIAAPSLNTGNFTSPTQAKYARMSERDEAAREAELQRVYRTIWMPEEVKHAPWDEEH
jgi:putative FmdB family regulatory protein